VLLSRYCPALLFGLLTISLPSWSAGPSTEELDDLFAVKGVIYRQDDGNDNTGGNPAINEDASIFEGIILFRKGVSERDVVGLELLLDMVSAASYDEVKERAETVSGATGDNIGRYGVKPNWTRRFDNWQLDLNISYALEFAYRSRGFGGTVSTDLAEGATSLSVGFHRYADEVRLIRFDGTKDPDDKRDTYTLDIGVTQSLTPISAINIGWSHTEQAGFLAT